MQGFHACVQHGFTVLFQCKFRMLTSSNQLCVYGLRHVVSRNIKWPPFAEQSGAPAIMGKGKKGGSTGLGKSLIKDKTRSKHIRGEASRVRHALS